ncbi:hypothetical protein DPMN_069417 [Dreissena polymorpha]|uniref:Uncharacterized protein n=1 Tax=Dreissena polymorpha TaxID=45954 RepID=A0A9D4BN22_DREPO|nr:hypothetical protein DPMN_069417 [Dreissena polymorpha]
MKPDHVTRGHHRSPRVTCGPFQWINVSFIGKSDKVTGLISTVGATGCTFQTRKWRGIGRRVSPRRIDVIIKRQFWVGRPMLIDRVVIRDLKQNFGWAWSMWAGRPSINRIVIREVQYQVNRCRNEEVDVK